MSTWTEKFTGTVKGYHSWLHNFVVVCQRVFVNVSSLFVSLSVLSNVCFSFHKLRFCAIMIQQNQPGIILSFVVKDIVIRRTRCSVLRPSVPGGAAVGRFWAIPAVSTPYLYTSLFS